MSTSSFGGSGDAFSGRGQHRHRNGEFVFQLVFCGQESRRLTEIIASLGGRFVDNLKYSSEVTHCVFGAGAGYTDARALPLRVVGYLASGKHVIDAHYLYKSFKAGRFMDVEDKFLPKITRHAREYRSQRGGKMLRNWTVSVILNQEKTKEFEMILADAGAKVVSHTPRTLSTTSPHLLRQLSHILTEPSYTANVDFGSFLNSNKRGGWNIAVYSYFYLIKFVCDPREEEQHRLKYFEIDNPVMINALHTVIRLPAAAKREVCVGDPVVVRAQSTLSSNSRRQLLLQPDMSKRKSDFLPLNTKRHCREVITLDDDEDEIRIVKDNTSHPPKIVRKQQQYPIPKLKPREVIDLVSSDDDDDVQVLETTKKAAAELVTICESGSEPEMDESEAESEDSDSEYRPDEDGDRIRWKLPLLALEETRPPPPVVPVKKEMFSIIQRSNSRVEEISLTDDDDDEMETAEDRVTAANDALPMEETPPDPEPILLLPPSVTAVAAGDPVMETLESPTEPAIMKTALPPPTEPAVQPPPTEPVIPVRPTVPRIEPKLLLKPSAANPSDTQTLQSVVNTLLKRQKDTNECVDLDNLRCRTIRFDSRGDIPKVDRRVYNKTAVSMDYSASYATFDVIDRDRLSRDVRVSTGDLIESLDNLGSMVDCWVFPPTRVMNKILFEYMQDKEVEVNVAQKAHELFARVMFLHSAVAPPSRKYFHSIFRKNFTEEGDVGGVDFWLYFYDLLKRCVAGKGKDVRCEMALDIVVSVMQKDVEFWWKHCQHKPREKPLIMFLFEKDSNVEKYTGLMAQELKLAIENNDMVSQKYLRRILATAGLLCSWLDKDNKLGGLNRKDSLKSKFSRKVSDAFTSLPEGRQLHAQLSLLRPAWLPLMVATTLVSKKHTVNLKESSLQDLMCAKLNNMSLRDGNPSSVEAADSPPSKSFKWLQSVMVDKLLATSNYHVIHRTLVHAQQNPAGSTNPYRLMKKLEPPSSAKSQSSNFCMDSMVVLERKDIESNVEYINKMVHPSETAGEDIDRVSVLFSKFAIAAD